MAGVLWDLTQLLAPKDCLICGEFAAGPLCNYCLSSLEVIGSGGCHRCHNPNVSGSALSCAFCQRLRRLPAQCCTLYAYRGSGRDFYQLVKYRGYWRLLDVLLRRNLNEMFSTLAFLDYDCLVPIPESIGRKVTRFFNPAAQLARYVSQATGLPIHQPLHLKLFRRHQVGLSFEERRKNAHGRFYSRGPVPPALILIDDVLTTGATLESAQQVLQASGAERIAWLTLFRTL